MEVRDFENHRWSEKRQKSEFRHATALALITGSPVLDVGCGDGLLLSMIKAKGMTAEGIDLSDVAVEQCRAQGLKAVRGDFANEPLPYDKLSFPYVVALDVLEHVYDPQKLLREMCRVSSHRIIIGVPNFSSVPARLQVLRGRVPENNRPHKGHIYWFNWPVLSTLIEKNGLRIVDLRVNAPWERIPLVGRLTKMLARHLPNLFALSFVVMCEARHS